MLLYLSSYGLGQDPSALVASRPGARAGLVFNARDPWPEARLRTWDSEVHDLSGLGYDCVELDLREHWSAGPGQLAEALAALDLVWVVGGNTFVLARAMSLAGFGPALRTGLSQGTLVYGGYSAGSCIAGPDLEGIDLMDEPDLVPYGYPADVAIETLGLVPFRIVPHVDSDHEESDVAGVSLAHLRAAGLDHRPLRDGEAFVVRDGAVTLVGAADPAQEH